MRGFLANYNWHTALLISSRLPGNTLKPGGQDLILFLSQNQVSSKTDVIKGSTKKSVQESHTFVAQKRLRAWRHFVSSYPSLITFSLEVCRVGLTLDIKNFQWFYWQAVYGFIWLWDLVQNLECTIENVSLIFFLLFLANFSIWIRAKTKLVKWLSVEIFSSSLSLRFVRSSVANFGMGKEGRNKNCVLRRKRVFSSFLWAKTFQF